MPDTAVVRAVFAHSQGVHSLAPLLHLRPGLSPQKPLPLRGPTPGPSSIFPPSSPVFLPIALLSPQGPKSRPGSAAQWLFRAKSWCPGSRTLCSTSAPVLAHGPGGPAPAPVTSAWDSWQVSGNLKHPFLPAPPGLAPREQPRPEQRAGPCSHEGLGSSLFPTALCKLLALFRSPPFSSSQFSVRALPHRQEVNNSGFIKWETTAYYAITATHWPCTRHRNKTYKVPALREPIT